MEMRIYVANLSLYNSGETLGDWFDLPVDYNDIYKKLRLEEEGFGEEYIILDYEFPLKIGEYESIDKLNELAEGLNELPEFLVDNLDEAVDYESIDEIISNGGENFMLYQGADDNEELGYAVIESVDGFENMSEDNMQRYFDYASFGRDVAVESSGFFHNGKYIEFVG